VPGIGVGAKMRGVNIGAGAGQDHPVDGIKQCADIGNVRRSRKHQRQSAHDFRHRTEVSFSDHLDRKSIFDAMGIPDHTDHRPPHRMASNPAAAN
jgi:hypothetical protein